MSTAGFAAAVAAQQAGDIARAQALCEAALTANANDADAWQLLGVLAQQAGEATRSRTFLERAVALRPADVRAHYNLAIAQAALGDVAAAIASYEAAVALAPSFAAAHSNLGVLYARTDRRGDALRAHTAAIQAQPDFAAAYCNLAAVLIELTRFEEAIRVLETATRVAPDVPEVAVNLAHAYRRSGRIRAALEATQRALALRPDLRAYLSLSLEAFEAGAFDIALDANLRALALDPASAAAHCNCATLYLTTGRYPEAIAACRAAIALAPSYAEAHVNLALALLVLGNYAEGWTEYAWTWELPARRPSYPYIDTAPPWNGEPFAGRQLLIAREQGFGDAILAARYLPAVKARGGRVVLEAAPALAALFADLPGVDELRIAADVGMRWDDVDLYVPVLGLPRAFKADLASIAAAAAPYLRAPADRLERWRRRLAHAQGFRVGIVWAGSPAHVDDRQRSASLEDFVGLGGMSGIDWFGLQKGRDETRRTCGTLALDPLGPEITDFADAAAIIAQLDLVIAVDTAIVHLAGALGAPVWTLLPFAPDWRWLLERTDTPWYPTMRLFRQPQPGDWPAVFAAVARDLAAHVACAMQRVTTIDAASR
jgi:tetratricopeptide (TPR) repeat protein